MLREDRYRTSCSGRGIRHRGCAATLDVHDQPVRHDGCRARGRVSTGQRLSQLGSMVALGQAGSNSKVSFEGPASGKGAVFKWSGNNEVGEGSMTIVDSQPAKQVRIELMFVRPFASTADTVFDFASAGSGTIVSWTMSGKNDNFIAKAFCLVMGRPDRMIGPEFEKGLAQMKAVVEKGAGKGQDLIYTPRNVDLTRARQAMRHRSAKPRRSWRRSALRIFRGVIGDKW